MLSIMQQDYQNYHIVFLDDDSDDGNTEQTIEFMKRIKFPKNRIRYVQNSRRMFATYNIVNAAFKFC